MRVLFITTGPQENPGPRTRAFQYFPHFSRDRIPHTVVQAGTRLAMAVSNARSRFERRPGGGALDPVVRFAGQKIFRTAELGAKVANELYRRGRLWQATAVAIAGGYDVVFAQAVILPDLALRLLHHTDKKIVYDLCDAIYTRSGMLRDAESFDRAVKQFDLVVLATSETEAYVRSRGNGNTMVVTGPIDLQRYTPVERAPREERVVIGWIGSASTTEYLDLISAACARVCRRFPNVVLKTIGAGKLSDVPGLRVEQVDWSLETEVEQLRDFDLGVMPLADDDWCRGKGGYKLLQYMALGLPCVASPVGVNREIVRPGVTGFLAKTEDEWVEHLSRLVSDAELRTRLGANGRAVAAAEYSFETYYPRLRAAMEALVAGRPLETPAPAVPEELQRKAC